MLRFAMLLPFALLIPTPATGAAEEVNATFLACGAGKRITCVVDGDTFWLRGDKIRIADINTPETHRPGCAVEAALGAQAKRRLTQLLNAGPFALESGKRDTDRYGRLLRTVTRSGKSLGEVLVTEGLAERWNGRRRNWC
ncbi:thermonuclease family protein [Altererythrobacter sp. ZODW24]|uniref:thermonuclease family protein n=1 Tax=Altererythrobacter sp. ZODW24 TaxID=2185142 RepID=UPI0019655F83|nr:thermonuclease family protein [Altererythrobacter sp. ZODW24]